MSSPASSLEDLQRRQREIEEENKRKKALLEKAVQERLETLDKRDGERKGGRREGERGLEGCTNTHQFLWRFFLRYLQSQAEVRKLHVVKGELDRLDFLVTRDVGILRNKIEEANREYNLARYTVSCLYNLICC